MVRRKAEEADSRLLGRHLLDDAGGGIGRSVVDDDHFLDDVAQGEHSMENPLDGLLFVVDGHENGKDIGVRSHRGRSRQRDRVPRRSHSVKHIGLGRTSPRRPAVINQ